MPHINRLVLNFPGFETTGAVHQIERLTNGGGKTAGLWGFNLSRGKIQDHFDNKTVAAFSSTGGNWSADTRFVQFSWQDIIARYENMPYPQSLFVNFPKYFSFFLDGSVGKYARASGRYWGFTIYPVLLMFLFAAVSLGLSYWLISGFGLHRIFILIPATILFLILCRFPGDLAYLNLSINDWGFARDMCRRNNPEIEKRYDLFAGHLIREISNSEHDEIIIVGHSFGSVWAVAALAKALDQKPGLLHNKKITFLALGSSLLKIALVKQALFFGTFLKRVLSQQGLLWHEIQTKTDFISFYKSDPFAPLKIMDTACDVIVHRVNFKSALSKTRHGKMKKSMYLAHRQYILYSDKRVHFDFQLRCFGPFLAGELARSPDIIENSGLIPETSESVTTS